MQKSKSIQYDALGLFVSPCYQGDIAQSDIKQLERIQSLNYAIEHKRSSVDSLGFMKSYLQNLNIQTSLSFSYLVTNGTNESLLGLSTKENIGFAYPLRKDFKNFYILVDNFDEESGIKTISLGNQTIESIQYQCQYNQFLTASVDTIGRNIQIEDGYVDNLQPYVSPKGIQSQGVFSITSDLKDFQGRELGKLSQQLVIKGSDLRLDFLEQSAQFSQLNIEGLNIQCKFDREQGFNIGDIYPYKRECLKQVVQIQLDTSVLGFESKQYLDFIKKNNDFINIDIIADKKCNEKIYDKNWDKPCAIPVKFVIRGAKIINVSNQVRIGERLQQSITMEINYNDLLSLGRQICFSGSNGDISFYNTPSGYGYQSGIIVQNFGKTGQFQEINRVFSQELPSLDLNILSGSQKITGEKRFYQNVLPEYQISGEDFFGGFTGMIYNPPVYIQTFVGTDPDLMPEEQAVYDIFTDVTGKYPFSVSQKNGYSGKFSLDIFVPNNEFKITHNLTGANSYIQPQQPIRTGFLEIKKSYLNYNYTGVITKCEAILNTDTIQKQYQIYVNS